MIKKAKRYSTAIWKSVLASMKTGKKALALVLAVTVLIAALPAFNLSASAAADSGEDPSYIAGKDGFQVVAYDKSARIEIPFVSGAKNYKVYLSQTEGLTDFSGASCVLNSDTYQSYTYAVNRDKDAANDSKTISIGYSDSEDNTYDFYLVTNDGSADTVQDSVEVKTRSTADAAWTTPGHYDTGWYGDGSASEFTIKTAAQLAGLAVLTDGLNGETATSFTGKTIYLASSVDLSNYLWTPIGTSGSGFSGIFDGGNYDKDGKYTVQNVISGLHTNDSSQSYQGLFGYAGNGSVIQKIGVVSGNINGYQYVGGITGHASNGTLSNSYNTSTVSGSGSRIGGVIGDAEENTTVTNCYNTGSVRGYTAVGGVTSYSNSSTVTNCYNTGTVSGTGYVGGVVSEASNSTMTNCYNTGAVSSSGWYVGGIVSMIFASSSMTNCYNTGAVSGSGTDVGGAAGITLSSAQIINCYNTGAVSGTVDNVGGVVGHCYAAVTNCYNTGAVSSTGDYVGGVVGNCGAAVTNCYNTGAVSGTGDHVGGVADSSSTTIKSSYSAGKVKGTDTYITYNASGTADSTATNQSDLTSKIDTGSDSAFVAAPTIYPHYPNREDLANGVFTSSNSVNGGYPVLRSFGYTNDAAANGFSPATITVAAGGKVTVGTDYGDGTESKPYIIRNAYQMDLVRSYTQTKDVYFKLAGNIDISPAQYHKISDASGNWKTIGGQSDLFKGSLDGNHFTVSGMFISFNKSNSNEYQGLFGITEGGTIQNLGTAGSCITADGNGYAIFGSIVGTGSGTIQNCYNAGTVSSYNVRNSSWIGGIIGQAGCYDSNTRTFYNTTIANCYNSGTIIGTGDSNLTGGVVGYVDFRMAKTSTLSCCYNAGTVAGSYDVGGVAGLWAGSFKDSFNVGKVSSTGSTGSTGYTGGVAGSVIAASNTNNIQSNCYNLGTVNNDYTNAFNGGVFGNCGGDYYSSVTGLVSNCYNTGTVYAGEAGGIAGSISCATVQNCYNTGKVNGISGVGGIGGGVSNATLQSCYNTGILDSTYTVGGIAGSFSGKMKNCYNTAEIRSTKNNVGGIAGSVSNGRNMNTVISTCYNTGNLEFGATAQNLGGIAGYFSDGSISLCYNLGTLSGSSGYAKAGIVGNLVDTSGATVSNCYYSGYPCGIGFGGWKLGDGAATPFVSCASQLALGKTSDISEVAYDKLDSDFKAAFGITAVQYPDGYESSDTDVLTVKNKTVTAVKAGIATVNGIAGEHSNAKIVVSQNALNMTDATSGFSGAGTDVVSGLVSLPVDVMENPEFTAFSVADSKGTSYTGKIYDSKNIILVKVPDGTDTSSLVATFTVNTGYVYANDTEQESGTTANNFSFSVTYSIFGSSNRDYTVMVVPESQSLAGIDDYSIKLGSRVYDGTIDVTKKTIDVTVPYDTDLTKLVADFSASNESDVTVDKVAQESGTTENDFSSPASYKVTGIDDSTVTYTVTVHYPKESEKSLTYFELDDSAKNAYTGTINQTKHTITVTVPKGTDLSSLTADFDTFAPSVKVGDVEQERRTTENDFSSPVTYTVTAKDSTTQDYIVTVAFKGESPCSFRSYSLTDEDGNTYSGTVDETAGTIAVTVPSGTDVAKLTATFATAAGATVTVGTTPQESGTTANNFTKSVKYTVKASDGSSSKTYLVTVTVKKNPCAFNSYSLEDADGNTYDGMIDKEKRTISVTVPAGTDVTGLTASFNTTAGTTAAVGAVPQESGTTANNFTDPVTYTVKSDDGLFSRDYTVTVTEAEETSIVTYSLTDDGGNTYNGTVDEKKYTIAVTVPTGTDVTGLIANFTAASTATVTVGETEQESGTTPNDFTHPVTYTVKASDDSTQDYPVTVRLADPNSFCSYSLTDSNGNTHEGTISKDKHTIAFTVQKGTDVKNMIANFTTTFPTETVMVGDDVQESGKTVNDFTKPVNYTVKTDDASLSNYIVTVTILSDHSKESSHHHSDSTAAEKPKTETKIDPEKNTASVATAVSDVKQNGNVAEMQISVPNVTIDTSNSGAALDLSKDAAVTVELPKNDIIQQMNSGKSVYVALTLPSEAKSGKSSNLSVSINAAKEILEAAKDHAQDVTLMVQYAGDHQSAYTLAFKGSDLAKSSAPIQDMDMGVKILPTKSVSKIDSITQKNQGIVVRFSQNGTMPAAATLKFSAKDQGFNANQNLDLYEYDPHSQQLIPTGHKVTVDTFGNASLSTDSGKEYVLLPDSVRTITLDTRIYTMNVGDSYETGITLLNAPAGSRIKAHSSTDGVIATTVLPNGDVKAVGLKPGLTYAMIDVYDSKNQFLTHASVRIIIKETDHPYGNSSRQFGIY